MHNLNISISYKSTFSGLQTIKVTFLILHHFSIAVLLLCLPLLSSPVATA